MINTDEATCPIIYYELNQYVGVSYTGNIFTLDTSGSNKLIKISTSTPGTYGVFLRAKTKGDIVGYNADPSACLNRLTEINCKFVKGNHDEYCSSNVPLNVFNPKIQETLKWTRRKLKRNEKAMLKNAP